MELMPKSSGIYKITDAKTGRFYVGSAVNFRARQNYHCYRLGRGDHPNPAMQAIWNSDRSRLSFHVVELCEPVKQALLEREQAWLDKSKVGIDRKCLNVLKIAGSHLGAKRSQQTRDRLSAAHKGRTFTQETLEKMRAAKLGGKLSDEHKRKIGDAAKGRKMQRPLGIVNLGLRKLSSEDLVRAKQLRFEGDSWKSLSREFGMCVGSIRRAVIGETYKC